MHPYTAGSGGMFPSPHPPQRPVPDTPPQEIEIERKLHGLRAARNIPVGEAAQMAMEEGMLRYDLHRAQRKRKESGQMQMHM